MLVFLVGKKGRSVDCGKTLRLKGEVRKLNGGAARGAKAALVARPGLHGFLGAVFGRLIRFQGTKKLAGDCCNLVNRRLKSGLVSMGGPGKAADLALLL
jgi:hypothetical protein